MVSLSLSLKKKKIKNRLFTFHSVASIASFSSFRDSGVAPAASDEEGGWAEDMRQGRRKRNGFSSSLSMLLL